MIYGLIFLIFKFCRILWIVSQFICLLSCLFLYFVFFFGGGVQLFVIFVFLCILLRILSTLPVDIFPSRQSLAKFFRLSLNSRHFFSLRQSLAKFPKLGLNLQPFCLNLLSSMHYWFLPLHSVCLVSYFGLISKYLFIMEKYRRSYLCVQVNILGFH